MAQRREARGPLSVELIDTAIAGRDYQIAAIRSVLEGIEARKRKFLLVMATGTEKTRTAAALVDVLMRAKWARPTMLNLIQGGTTRESYISPHFFGCWISSTRTCRFSSSSAYSTS